MELNINKIDEDKLPIKYILGIQEELESFPDAFDIVHIFIARAVRQPDRQKASFTKHALNKYFAKGKDENVDSGLVEAIGMGLIEQTSSAEGKEAYKILINPFI
tara:strand:+ start:3031 stop:3342 length:312 start_codon:yes stop_codon:yes gene_type:complete